MEYWTYCLQQKNSNMTSKFKQELKALYEDLKKNCEADERLVPFIHQVGKGFPLESNTGIMFYGRATNGWYGTWDIDNLFDEDNPDRGWMPDDSLAWVNDASGDEQHYNSNRSQFWQVIKGVTTHFWGNEWEKYCFWSNVCKAAPYYKGNPSDAIYYRTLDTNVRIMAKEIEFYSPKFVVMFTGGRDWVEDGKPSKGGDWSSDFLKGLNNGDMPKTIDRVTWDDSCNDRIVKVHKIGQVYFLITLHPQGKKIQPHIDGLVKIIEDINNNHI